jgi:hypothetical protein
MKSLFISSLLFLFISISSCNFTKRNKEIALVETKSVEKDSVVFSFSFLGCNRVDKGDANDTVPSTANKYVLERIFNEVNSLPRKPEIFFFLGDMVLAATNKAELNTQLKAWSSLYENDSISKSGIEMVAVPGNHELLYGKMVKVKKKGKKKKKKEKMQFPLAGSTDIWLKHMKPYMPADRDTVTGSNKMDNRLTYAFVRENIGFVVMNTDSYNPPTKKNKYGKEGMIPTSWVIDKVNEFKVDKRIEHIFVLGHKPYYINNKTETGHSGLPAGPVLWPALEEARVVAMLSGHKHDYQRWQPINKDLGGGTYQIIAGNGGSKGVAPFFGYSTISIMASGDVKLSSVGFCKGDPYYAPVPENPTTRRDEVLLTWGKNANEYTPSYKECK